MKWNSSWRGGSFGFRPKEGCDRLLQGTSKVKGMELASVTTHFTPLRTLELSSVIGCPTLALT